MKSFLTAFGGLLFFFGLVVVTFGMGNEPNEAFFKGIGCIIGGALLVALASLINKGTKPKQ